MKKLRASIASLKARGTVAMAALFLLATGTFAILPAGVAHAVDGAQFCYIDAQCLNAWGGGPSVVINTPNSPHDKFTLIKAGAGGGYINIEYTGVGAYDGDCIGDYANNPNTASTGLVGGCGTTGIGWGGNFTEGICHTGDGKVGYDYYNAHWGGWLAPSNSGVVGQPFYLNAGSPTCFALLVP